jgi:collagen type VII alpha
MTTYKELFGKAVKYLSTDPDNAQAEGQVWYNSTSGTFKSIIVGAAWSSGSPLITARYYAGGAGTQTAGLVFGGAVNPPFVAVTEEYNGSGWSTGGSLSTARTGMTGAGTQTAGLCVGGYNGTNLTNVEHYNGSSWTSGTAYPTATRYASVVGILTAAVTAGGFDTSYANSSNEYDGSTWTAAPNINTTRSGAGRSGTQTAGLIFGGDASGASTTAAENYNGSTWTTGTSLNTPTRNSGSSVAGTNTAALNAGGTNTTVPAVISTTEIWNGSTWTTSSSLGTARQGLAGMGTSIAALVAGGEPPTTGVTEEYNQSTSIITAAAWSSGTNLPTATRSANTGPVGTIDSTFISGGTGATGVIATTQEWNGATWSTGGDQTTPQRNTATMGTQTAGLMAGGLGPSPATITTVQEYNGTSWATNNPINNSRGYASAGAGTQTAAMVAGGYSPPVGFVPSTEFGDGTSWTTIGGTMVTGIYAGATGGTQGAAWSAAGQQESPPLSYSTNFQTFDGTSWSAGNPTLSVRNNQFGGGLQTTAWIAGGDAPPYIATTEHNDGTTWYTQPSMSSARTFGGSSGTNSNSFAMGGGNVTGSVVTVEEYNGETSAFNFKTITTS